MKVIVSGFSGRALSETAAQAGCKISCIDFFGDLDLKKFCRKNFSIKHDSAEKNYSTQILLDLIENNYDDEQYFVYSSDWDNKPELLNKVLTGKDIKLLGNSAETLQKVKLKRGSITDKQNLFSFLKRKKFSLPKIIKSEEELKKEREIDSNRKYLLKPYLSGGGKNIKLYPDLSTAQKEIEKEMWNNFYLQQYIEGKVSSALFAADEKNAEILGVTEQLKDLTKDSFKYGGNILIKPDLEIISQLKKMASELTENFGLKGINGIDFILSSDGIYFIELNPRFTAAVELLLPIFGAELFELYFYDRIDQNLSEKYISSEMPLYAKIIYYAKTDLTVKKEITELLDYKSVNMNGKYEFRDFPHPGEEIEKHDPVSTVLVSSGSRQKLFEMCRKAFAFLEEFALEEV